MSSQQLVHVLQKLKHCYFLGHYKYHKCQTLHDGSAHSALPIHTAFSDLDCILKSQQCHHRRPYSRGIIEMFSDLTKT